MSDIKPDKIILPLDDVITEQDIAESEQERAGHAALKLELAELLKHPAAVDVAAAVRRLIDRGVKPIIVAKTLLIGDRGGGMLYEIAARSSSMIATGPLVALGDQERACELLLGSVLADLPGPVAAVMCTVGATWLAEQYHVQRSVLRDLVVRHAARPFPVQRRGCPGALDYVDDKHVASRAWLLDAIDTARLPEFAPLEYSRWKP